MGLCASEYRYVVLGEMVIVTLTSCVERVP